MAGGTRLDLFRAGGLRVAAKTDAFAVEIDATQTAGGDGGAAIPDVSAEANRARLALEAGWTWVSSQAAALGSKLEIAGRRDGGDAEEGYGVEVGGELSFRHVPSGLEISGRGRLLAAHQASDYEEWGASATIRLTPGGDGGRGLSLMLTPVLGTETGSRDALWGDDRLLRRLTSAPGRASDAGGQIPRRLGVRVAYGLVLGAAPDATEAETAAPLRPFAELSLADGTGLRGGPPPAPRGERRDVGAPDVARARSARATARVRRAALRRRRRTALCPAALADMEELSASRGPSVSG